MNNEHFEELAENYYEWYLIECNEIRGDIVSVMLSNSAIERITQYMIEHKTRAIPLLYLQDYEPEVFATIENIDEEDGPCIQFMHPFDLANYQLAVQEHVLEEALDQMPTDEYVQYTTYGELQIINNKPFQDVDIPTIYDIDLEALSLYKRQGNNWISEKVMCFELTLTKDSIPTLIHYMYNHHTRMISLYDLRNIAPQVCASLNNIDEEWSIDEYSDKGLQQLYVGLRGDIVEFVFDLIYDLNF